MITTIGAPGASSSPGSAIFAVTIPAAGPIRFAPAPVTALRITVDDQDGTLSALGLRKGDLITGAGDVDREDDGGWEQLELSRQDAAGRVEGVQVAVAQHHRAGGVETRVERTRLHGPPREPVEVRIRDLVSQQVVLPRLRDGIARVGEVAVALPGDGVGIRSADPVRAGVAGEASRIGEAGMPNVHDHRKPAGRGLDVGGGDRSSLVVGQ